MSIQSERPMVPLSIVHYPTPVLLKKAKPVTNINGLLQNRIDKMIETLYASAGLGLAAPQVGDPHRLFVYDLSMKEEKKPGGHPSVIINPEIIAMEGEETTEEGCLSLPGYFEMVARAQSVQMKGVNRNGKEVCIEAHGLLARLIQHEVDHLNGVLMFDRLGPLKRNILLRKLKKKIKQEGEL